MGCLRIIAQPLPQPRVNPRRIAKIDALEHVRKRSLNAQLLDELKRIEGGTAEDKFQ